METHLTPQQILLQNERHVLVGNICHQWAYIEYLGALAIWSVLGVDYETGVILTGGVPIRARFDMAHKLANHLGAPPRAIAALEATKAALAGGLENKRNRAVHGVRFADEANPANEFIEMHRGSPKGRHPQSNQDLRDLSAALDRLGQKLYSELTEVGIFRLPMRKPAAAMALKTAQARSPSDSHPGS